MSLLVIGYYQNKVEFSSHKNEITPAIKVSLRFCHCCCHCCLLRNVTSLNFEQMDLGSIHNFPNLRTIIITDRDSGTCQLPEPSSSSGLGTCGFDFTLPVVSPRAAYADKRVKDRVRAHPSMRGGRGTLRFLGIVPTEPYVTTESNCFFHI